jgi:xanthine dehydrogenase YagS FAD-binding subunit
MTLDGGRIGHVRVALGGVGTRPWHALEAEAVLRGATPDAATFRKAADAALANAKPQSQNGFKVELARRCIVHALTQATATP